MLETATAEGGQDFQVALDGVDLTLGDRSIFRSLSCGFPRGQISIVLGGSGAGKSTILRLIGGLLRPQSGVVRVAGQDITGVSDRELYQVRMRIGMLFQGGALLDSMTVYENVSLPLREHTDLREDAIAEAVRERLEAVGLSGTEALYPRQLSGGMVRRAALARAIVRDPELVLVDEPFSGLDPVNVRRIEALMVELNRRRGITLIVTSHHLASSLRMGHRLVFLTEGHAIAGSPAELLASEDSRIVEFLRAEQDGDELPVAAGSGGPP